MAGIGSGWMCICSHEGLPENATGLNQDVMKGLNRDIWHKEKYVVILSMFTAPPYVYQQIVDSLLFQFVLRTLFLMTRLQVKICIGAQRFLLCFVKLSWLFCSTVAPVKIGRSC
jgi:hypothetical protein